MKAVFYLIFKRENFFLFFLLLFTNSYANFVFRPTSEPYISGDTFRGMCDFALDRDYNLTNSLQTSQTLFFDPLKVKKGDLIFVDIWSLDEFFSYYHPRITEKYILVSHNHDYGVPGKFKKYLNDDKLYVWFSQNVEEVHEKLIPIPIGLSNMHWNFDHSKNNICKLSLIQAKIGKFSERPPKLLYINFCINTNLDARFSVLDLFIKKGYVLSEPVPYKIFLSDMAKHKFTLSPKGNGLDCHRTWEALYVGSIPIVKKSAMDPVFDLLPVLILDDWDVINDDFLFLKYEEIKKKPFLKEKLYFKYWKKLILDAKERCIKTEKS